MFSPLHQQLLNDYQHDFPLSPRPYQDIALSLGVTEAEVLLLFKELTNKKFISRIGSVIAPNNIGVSTLVAMAIPTEKLQAVAKIVSQQNEVNHNYERENRFNLWFVLMAKNDKHLQKVIHHLEIKTGFKAMQLPLLKAFYIDLGFKLEFDD